MSNALPRTPGSAGLPRWPGVATWVLAWGGLLLLDGQVDLAQLALLLVLASALATLWLPAWAALLSGVAAVAAFNWCFVPPRYSWAVDLHQHVLLLGVLLGVNALVSGLLLSLRRSAHRASQASQREAALRSFGDLLRDAAEPGAYLGQLQSLLAEASDTPVALWVADALHAGHANADQQAGLALCAREGRALGHGSGWHEEQPDIYLPLRGRAATPGAAVLPGLGARKPAAELRAHLQALCDQMGQALQRAALDRAEQQAREQAREQGVRNALLAAIAHDYRTPLATIMGAASSLHDQAERMDAAQRQRLAAGIVDETQRLARLTDNTLQLARLGAPGVTLRCDWESAEDIVGALLARVRKRPDGRRVHVHLEPDLPLLWCDALLVSQLLDNLVDNALKYSPPDSPVELQVGRVASGLKAAVLLAVRDRGAGVAPAWRERIFQVFQRGQVQVAPGAAAAGHTGSGVGLAVCKAIAEAHGGTLALRGRTRGGSSFECTLPLREAPAPPGADA